MNEREIDLLEAYLDDALLPDQVQRVDQQVNDQAQWSEALDALKQRRADRVAAFASGAPAQAEADQFANQLLASLRQREWQKKWSRVMRGAAAVAACVLLGFGVGWIERGQRPAPAPIHARSVEPRGRGDSRIVLHAPKPAEAAPYQVAVLDEDGNVIAVQPFNKLEEARQFADDLAQYQARRQQVQEGQAMLVSDQF